MAASRVYGSWGKYLRVPVYVNNPEPRQISVPASFRGPVPNNLRKEVPRRPVGTVCLHSPLPGTGVGSWAREGGWGWEGEGQRAPQRGEAGTVVHVGPSLHLEQHSRLVRGPGGGLELSRRHAKCGAPGPGPVSGQYCARHVGLHLVSPQMLGVDLILPRTQCGPARSQSSISHMSSRSPICGCPLLRLPLLRSGLPIPHEPARILEVFSFPKEHLFSEASDGFLPALRLESRP